MRKIQPTKTNQNRNKHYIFNFHGLNWTKHIILWL